MSNTLKTIYKKFINGDVLTDYDCQNGEKLFRETSDRLSGIPEFQLTANELYRVSNRLYDYMVERGLKRL